MNGFSITYQMTRADYQAMLSAVLTRPLWYRIVIVIGCLSAWIAIALYLSKTMDDFWRFLSLVVAGRAGWPLYAALAALPLILFWEPLMAFIGSFSFRKNALAKHPTSVRADGDQIEIKVAELVSTIPWASITKVVETKKRLLLMIATQQAIILPRSAFASEADYTAARDFSLAHVDLEVPVVKR